MKQEPLFDPSPSPIPLRRKNGVEHRTLACRTLLNYCDTYRMPDTFTINPYRGCEFGCSYCYARYTHEFMELDWHEFETRIFVKQRASDVLLRTLDRARIGGRHIAIGTATDPYQPAEARFGITRSIMEVFARVSGFSLSITTKSSLIRRDLDLLEKVAGDNELQVNISLISLDEELLARLEPRASRPRARLRALQDLSSRGIAAGIFLMPILPGITDSPENLESVVRAARDHGARFLGSNLLFLRDSARSAFFDYLKRCQPNLFHRYRRLYGRGAREDREYRRRVMERVSALKRKYGLESRRYPAGAPSREPGTLFAVDSKNPQG